MTKRLRPLALLTISWSIFLGPSVAYSQRTNGLRKVSTLANPVSVNTISPIDSSEQDDPEVAASTRDEVQQRGNPRQPNSPEDKRLAEPRAVLVSPNHIDPNRLMLFGKQGINTVVLLIDPTKPDSLIDIRKRVQWVREANLAVGYWLEVARSPELAEQHPEWMASLQTHDEWRRMFPETLTPKPDEVTKTYPWVPILSRETFEAQKDRIIALAKSLPPGQLIFLNDLQGAPSACGCGNDLCRWTSDYGERRTTIPLDDHAAANFVLRIKHAFPDTTIVPVWTTECEEQDGHPNGQCAGVGCFKGICWKAYTKQLMPVSDVCDVIGLLALENTFKRQPPEKQNHSSWLAYATNTFQTMPALNKGSSIPKERLITVIEGYQTQDQDLSRKAQICQELGVAGYVIALDKIDQSWSPKIVRWKESPSIP